MSPMPSINIDEIYTITAEVFSRFSGTYSSAVPGISAIFLITKAPFQIMYRCPNILHLFIILKIHQRCYTDQETLPSDVGALIFPGFFLSALLYLKIQVFRANA